MCIYARSDNRILEVNDAAVNSNGYYRIEFSFLFYDDLLEEEKLTDFSNDSESALVKTHPPNGRWQAVL